jgi:hypothetical protein
MEPQPGKEVDLNSDAKLSEMMVNEVLISRAAFWKRLFAKKMLFDE